VVDGTATELGATLEPRAAAVMISRLGLNRWQLLQELQKLLLLSPQINSGAGGAVCGSWSNTGRCFQLVEAMMNNQEAAVFTKLENLLLTGEAELRLLGLIAYQLRTVLLIQTGLQGKLGSEQMATQFKLHPYVIKKNMRLAQRYGGAQLLDMYTRVLATDFAMKQGKVDMRTGLIMLVRGLVATKIPRRERDSCYLSLATATAN
jgi:DNA polymerase-3 subunit delta